MEQTTVIGPSVIGPTVIGSGVVGPTVVGPGDQTGRPYIRVVDVLELRFDKMSNEGVLQCPSSHQNTIWWIRRAFSGDSQNTD